MHTPVQVVVYRYSGRLRSVKYYSTVQYVSICRGYPTRPGKPSIYSTVLPYSVMYNYTLDIAQPRKTLYTGSK
jgi:hypothetical protein